MKRFSPKCDLECCSSLPYTSSFHGPHFEYTSDGGILLSLTCCGRLPRLSDVIGYVYYYDCSVCLHRIQYIIADPNDPDGRNHMEYIPPRFIFVDPPLSDPSDTVIIRIYCHDCKIYTNPVKVPHISQPAISATCPSCLKDYDPAIQNSSMQCPPTLPVKNWRAMLNICVFTD